jgi:hypothetical protein
VRRQAIVAAIALGHRKRDALAGRGVELALSEGAAQPEKAFERGRAGAHQAKQVRHYAELFFDGLKQWLGGGWGFPDRGWNRKGGHGEFPFACVSGASSHPLPTGYGPGPFRDN